MPEPHRFEALASPGVADQVATAALPQYNRNVRRLFLFPRYQRDAAKLLSPGEQDEMERHIADDPERHPRIPGGSGMRKARWSRRGSGKRGRLRSSGRNILYRRVCQK
jgi:hypothetical protein